MTINENTNGLRNDFHSSQQGPTTPFDNNTFNTEHLNTGTIELEVSKVTQDAIELLRQ